jgi:VWFA-related protein
MRVIALISIIVAGSVALPASLGSRSLAPQDRPTFKSSSELVVLHVSVRDGRGRYVAGLPQDAFTVIDDGRAQTLEMFSAEEVPATVGVLIDNSNSMQPNRDRVIASAVAFATHSHPQDELFVLTFNEKVQHAFGPRVVADVDPGVFAQSMSHAIVARGMTAIYDGILAGLSRLEHAMHTRQVLIVVSDGGDNASRAKLDDVLTAVHDSNATVYSVALVDALVRDGSNPGLLRRLARATGGEFYEPRKTSDVPEAFERISKDIRNAYTIAYRPTQDSPAAADRRRRTVRVYVRSQDGKALNVRTRDGYFEKRGEGPQ